MSALSFVPTEAGFCTPKLQVGYLQYRSDSPPKLPALAASSLANDGARPINQTSTMDRMENTESPTGEDL